MHFETQRRIFGPAACRDRKDDRADADADDRQVARKEIRREAHFGRKGRKQVTADHAERACAEDNQPVMAFC